MTGLMINDAEGPCHCDNCAWEGDAVDLDAIEDAQERLSAGGIVPAGECPDCGGLVYLDNVPDWAKPDAMHILKDALKNGALRQADVLQALHDASSDVKVYAAEVTAARDEHVNDEREIDASPLLSVSDEGVWVSGWFWVPFINDACDNCGETLQDGSGTCITCGQEGDA